MDKSAIYIKNIFILDIIKISFNHNVFRSKINQ